jgi:hypothetical protein
LAAAANALGPPVREAIAPPPTKAAARRLEIECENLLSAMPRNADDIGSAVKEKQPLPD